MEVDSGFGELLQQAQQLAADMDGGTELPRVHRSLQQLREAASRMAAHAPASSATAAAREGGDVKASLLLGARGYDLQKVTQKLEGLSAMKTFEPLEPIKDTDIQGFLKNERENALLTAIEQTRKNTFAETERHHWKSMAEEWEREKQKILNALVTPGQDVLDLPAQSMCLPSESVQMTGRSGLDNVEMAYAREVYVYNDHVVQGGIKPSLVDMFTKVADTLDDKKIPELWSMVTYMTEVPTAMAGSAVKARISRKMQMAYVQQARKYLERSYERYVCRLVHGRLQSARLGGVPGVFNLVRSYLNVQLPTAVHDLEDGEVDGLPVWPLIYYCMRCGDLQAAWQVIAPLQQNLGDFGRFFMEYMYNEDRRLGANSEREIRLQYKRAIRNSADPYKRAVYCLVGKCEPRDNHADVAHKTDDYLWIKLSQLSFDDDYNVGNTAGTATDRLTLPQLQSLLLEEHGESHFDAYQQPLLYFQVLMLSAQFEAAIDFLSRIPTLRAHAMHVALAMHELGVLLLPDSTHAALLSRDTSDPEPLRRLNFARLVKTYTRKFEMTDPREALQYFYFLRELKTSDNEQDLFQACVSELAIQTKEFDLLLGQLGNDGCRKPGAIDKFQGDAQKIIDLVSGDVERKGQLEDAVRLYDLAQNHDKVLELLNKLLCQVLPQPPTPQSTRDRLKQLGVNIAERYQRLGIEGSKHNTSTFHLLLDLLTFFEYYHTGKLDQAYKVIQELKLLPFTVEAVEEKVKLFRHYTDEVRRSLPDILLATMNILYSQYKTAKGAGPQSPQTPRGIGSSGNRDDGGKQTYINYLRSQARALITFAGIIPYRMPSDTNARLVQMEVLMN